MTDDDETDGTGTGDYGWEWLPPEAIEPSHSDRLTQAVYDALVAEDRERLRVAFRRWAEDVQRLLDEAQRLGVVLPGGWALRDLRASGFGDLLDDDDPA